MKTIPQEIQNEGRGFKTTKELHDALHEGLTALNSKKQLAIFLRFWEHKSIKELSETFRLTWDEADRLINDSLSDLKFYLHNHRNFSQARAQQLQALDWR